MVVQRERGRVSERKLKAWADAGLIDDAAVARIRNWEAENARPFGLWALVGLGALAIGLGLVSVVAANWDAIPGMARLSIHAVLIVAMAGFMAWRHNRAVAFNALFHDAMLFVLGALGLTFFGHVGQVYQTSAPLWQPFGLWLLLFTPLLLGFGRGWLAAAMWMAAACFTAFEHWDWYLAGYDIAKNRSVAVTAYMGLVSSLPAFVMALAAWMRGRGSRPDFWRRLEQIGLILILVWLSSGWVYGVLGASGRWAFGVIAIESAVLLLAAAATYFARPGRSGQSTAAILVAASLSNLTGHVAAGDELGGALAFMLAWSAVAGAALHAGWRMIFQVAVAVLALRLIILSFELAGDLLGSGLGLIFAGMATLGIAWLAVRITKQYAPKGDAA